MRADREEAGQGGIRHRVTSSQSPGRCSSLFLGALLAAGVLSSTLNAYAELPPPTANPNTGKYVFPLWGRELAKRGIRFPLPAGLGINYAYVDQPIAIDNISIAVNDGEYVNLDEYIEFGELRSKVALLNARADLWVLPFLNVYALGNYVIESSTTVQVVQPFEFTAGATQGGGGGGFGFTGSYGYAGFFGTLDLNWTWNRLEKLSVPVGTFLLTPRVGRNFGRVGPVELVFWVGAMSQTIQSDTSGSISLQETLGEADLDPFREKLEAWYDGLGPVRQRAVDQLVDGLEGADPIIHYRLDKRVAEPWNALIGTEIGLSDAWRIRAELGFLGRTQVMIGVNYRFGLFVRPPEKTAEPAAD